jgi:energy-coupling factor transporter ATP-binding protein EcfA2
MVMVKVEIFVTDEVAQKLTTLVKTGRVTDRSVTRRSQSAGIKAYRLLTDHARPLSGSKFREVVIDGVTHLAPRTLIYTDA